MKLHKIVVLFSSSVLFIACHQRSGNNGEKALVIGASMLSLQSEFVVNVKDALEERAKEKHVELVVSDAQRTAEK